MHSLVAVIYCCLADFSTDVFIKYVATEASEYGLILDHTGLVWPQNRFMFIIDNYKHGRVSGHRTTNNMVQISVLWCVNCNCMKCKLSCWHYCLKVTMSITDVHYLQSIGDWSLCFCHSVGTQTTKNIVVWFCYLWS